MRGRVRCEVGAGAAVDDHERARAVRPVLLEVHWSVPVLVCRPGVYKQYHGSNTTLTFFDENLDVDVDVEFGRCRWSGRARVRPGEVVSPRRPVLFSGVGTA